MQDAEFRAKAAAMIEEFLVKKTAEWGQLGFPDDLIVGAFLSHTANIATLATKGDPTAAIVMFRQAADHLEAQVKAPPAGAAH